MGSGFKRRADALEAACDAAPIGLAVFDRERRCAFANKACGRLLRRDRREMVGETISECFREDAKLEDLLDLAATSHGEEKAEVRLPGSGSERLMAELHCTAARDHRGKVESWSVTLAPRPASELRGLERDRLAAIVDATPDLIGIFDRRGRVEYLNTSARRFLGVHEGAPLDAVVIFDFYPRDHERLLLDEALPGAQERGLWAGETAVYDAQGRLVPVWEVILAHRDASGRVDHFSSIVRDLSSQKRYEQELQRARDLSEAASRGKSELLAHISHEIRTPMTAILGYTALLRARVEEGSARRDLKIIQRSGEYLLQVLGDLLDLTRIEAGRISLQREPVPLDELLMDVSALMRVRAAEKHLGFRVESEGLIPAFVEGDVVRLRQVLVNLVSNALKFTERGEVSVKARLHQPHVLELEVRDTGPGMSEEQLRAAFEPFMQGGGGMTKRYGGTGLGLAITKRLVEQMGGEIAVTTAPGKGATFSVRLPIGPLDGVELLTLDVAGTGELGGDAVGAVSPLRGRLLVVDDQPEIAELLQRLFASAGCSVDTAANGAEAIERVQREGPYDVVLMDMHMPVLDGYEATRELRARGYEKPIIALSASVLESERRRALEAGCDAFMGKPLKTRELAQAVRRWVAPAAEHAPTKGPERVLVVDDSAELCELVAELLRSEGCVVETALSGASALSKAARFHPDVALVDLGLPDMDGTEVARRLSDPSAAGDGAAPRLVAMTGRTEPEELARAHAAGFSEELIKPFDPDVLTRLVRR